MDDQKPYSPPPPPDAFTEDNLPKPKTAEQVAADKAEELRVAQERWAFLKPGQPGNPGRAKGHVSAKARRAADICQRLVEDPEYLEATRNRMIAGTEDPSTVRMIWARGFGAVPEKLDVDVNDKRDGRDLSEESDTALAARAVELAKAVLNPRREDHGQNGDGRNKVM